MTAQGLEIKHCGRISENLLSHIVDLYSFIYLYRRPTVLEMNLITNEYEAADLPGCESALDCMHFIRKNCPLSEKGQHYNLKQGST